MPNNDRSTRASAETSRTTKTLPSYMRPTKATRRAYTPPVKSSTNTTPATRSSRLDFAIRGEQAKRPLGLAKGRLLGVQFNALMTDNLYERTAEREVGLAMRLRAAFVSVISEGRDVSAAVPVQTPMLTVTTFPGVSPPADRPSACHGCLCT